ncbi:hypothetical protein HPB50_012090 [Hyalomma asiaticum]|uniref:Uncharacterized protein n=1 Tax=Hyalomma asiaticum TaxID=266040 RepID=A0ACB7SH40_HYAAI|nr:hypothetical protein HPB50_012090 [Hyalomma asiaticum]
MWRCRARAIAAEGPPGRNNNRPGPTRRQPARGPRNFGGENAATEQPKSPIKRSPHRLASLLVARARPGSSSPGVTATAGPLVAHRERAELELSSQGRGRLHPTLQCLERSHTGAAVSLPRCARGTFVCVSVYLADPPFAPSTPTTPGRAAPARSLERSASRRSSQRECVRLIRPYDGKQSESGLENSVNTYVYEKLEEGEDSEE